MRLILSLWFGMILSSTAAGDLLESHRFIELTRYEADSKLKRVDAIADRVRYWDDDPVGQFVLNFLGESTDGRSLRLVVRHDDREVWSKSMDSVAQPKLALLLKVNQLPVGRYVLRGELTGAPAVVVEVSFEREAKRRDAVIFPADGIRVDVQAQTVTAEAAWPVTVGVSFPQGMISDMSQLRLFEDGRLVPAQFDVISTWHPRSYREDSDHRPSIRWAHVKFLARHRGGMPASYVIRQGGDRPAYPPLVITDDENTVVIDTSAAKIAFSRRTFVGIASATIAEGQIFGYDPAVAKDVVVGPFVQDHRGIVFQARHDPDVSVVVEEAGPLRAVVAVEGWYVNPEIQDAAARRLCRFRTRFIAWAGDSRLRIQHHTIITFDTDKVRLMDVGWTMPVAGGVRQWTVGVDGAPVGGEPDKRASNFLHQYRWDRLRVRDASGKMVEGGKADGYMTIRNDAGTATICLRDIWQKFPRELEVDSNGAAVHFWPKHGIRTFDENEIRGRAEIYKLRHFHHGRLLDLRFPSESYDAIQEFNEQTRDDIDPEGTRNAALSGNAQGVAIGADMLIRLDTAQRTDALELARLFQVDPHARTDPRWTVATGVEGQLAATDYQRYPQAERAIDELYPSYMAGVVERTAEYGMFIYANWHNAWLADMAYPRMHRVWQNSHYQQVGIPWLLYMRGASPELLTWARANSDNFRDVGTINHHDDQQRIPYHNSGAMYHAKGFTPWGSAGADAKLGTTNTWAMYHAGVQAHFVNPDAFLLRYLMEGDLRSRDVYRMWARSWTHGRVWSGASREINNTLGEAINLYVNFHDPDALRAIRIQADSMLSVPMVKMPHAYAHPIWHLAWYTRLHDMTRDPRIGTAVVKWCETYTGHISPNVFAYRVTGDKSYLARNTAAIYDTLHTAYRNTGDPLHGFSSAWYSYGQWFYRALPYYMWALNDAGIAAMEVGESLPRYPSRATHPQFIDSEGPALKVIAVDPDDRGFRISLTTDHACYRPAWRFSTPSGKVINEVLKGEGSQHYTGDDAVHVEVRSDGEKGVYVLDFRSWEGVVFKPPLTTLPLEGTMIAPDRPVRLSGRLDAHIMPVKSDAPVELTFKAIKYHDICPPGYVRVRDKSGNILLDDTLLVGSTREALIVRIDPTVNPGPYHLLLNGGVGPDITASAQTGEVILAIKASDTLELVRHVAAMRAK